MNFHNDFCNVSRQSPSYEHPHFSDNETDAPMSTDWLISPTGKSKQSLG